MPQSAAQAEETRIQRGCFERDSSRECGGIVKPGAGVLGFTISSLRSFPSSPSEPRATLVPGLDKSATSKRYTRALVRLKSILSSLPGGHSKGVREGCRVAPNTATRREAHREPRPFRWARPPSVTAVTRLDESRLGATLRQSDDLFVHAFSFQRPDEERARLRRDLHSRSRRTGAKPSSLSFLKMVCIPHSGVSIVSCHSARPSSLMKIAV